MSALPTHCKLSTETVSVSDVIIGEGTLVYVKVGHLNSLDLQCAVKKGKEKSLKLESPVFKARALQALQGCEFFPFVFGVYDNRLVLELIYSGSDYCNANTIAYCNANTIANLQKSSKITCLEWIRISYQLATAAKNLHLSNILYNDIKANNVLFKLKEGNWIPKLTDIGKVTLKSEPEVYGLSASQTEKYNKKYPYLAYELFNAFGTKTSSACDVYSLGYIFKYLPIKISYHILISKMMV